MMTANLAAMTTLTTGTGTVTLAAAVSGFLTFAQAGFIDGDIVSYTIEEGSNREVGWGVYTASGTTLTRNVRASTNGGAAISLAGSARVFATILAEDILSAIPYRRLFIPLSTTYEPQVTASGGAGAGDMSSRGSGINLQTGTSATGKASARYTLTIGAVGQPLGDRTILEAYVYIPTLSTASEEFRFAFGFTDEWTFGGIGSNAVCFVYDRAGSGVNWRAVTRASGVSTDTDTGVAVVAATLTRLKIMYDSASRVRFAVDTTVVSNTTNIPGTSTVVPTAAAITKIAGTTMRSASIFSPVLHRMF